VEDVRPHIVKLVNQVASGLLEKGEAMLGKRNRKSEDEFWGGSLNKATILLRCLNSAVLHDKLISKIYQLDRSTSVTVYGVPVPSKDKDRNFDFLILDGNGHFDDDIVIQIQSSDSVNVWHTFRSVV
jgi:hypothetical protein